MLLLPDPAPPSTNIHLNKYLKLSSELGRQLEQWYDSIPDRVRPPLGTEHIASDRGEVLRLHYHAARHIINRPFVHYVTLLQTPSSSHGSTPGTPQPLPQVPQVVLGKCEACIASCQTYLYNVVNMLGKRTPYLWTFSQGSVACLLVLRMAESSPQLRPFITDLEQLQTAVIQKLSRWATKGSSFERVVEILEHLHVPERYT
jgi:hypothetical protein